MRLLVKMVLFAAFVGCVAWAVFKPGFDSITAAIVTLGTLLGAFVVERRAEPTLSQRVEKGGKGFQAGGNITITKK